MYAEVYHKDGYSSKWTEKTSAERTKFICHVQVLFFFWIVFEIDQSRYR